MNLFPFFANISGSTFLIIGGGSVAKEKISSIRRFGEKIIVVAENTDILPEDGLEIIVRAFREEDLDRADYVIAATDDHELQIRIAKLCRERKIPVNVADEPSLCTFVMPSIIKQGRLVGAFSTNGASPAYAKHLREQVEAIIPDDIDEILGKMEALRAEMKERIADPEERKALYRSVLSELLK